MAREHHLGIDCGSTSLNLVLTGDQQGEPISVYRRTRGRPLETLVKTAEELIRLCEGDVQVESCLVTGSGRDLISRALGIAAVNEITAHAVGVYRVDPRVRTIIEIGGQDSKFIRLEPPSDGRIPRFPVFRMNEICAAGTGAFLDEQAGRLGIPVESFGSIALESTNPAPIAGRCAVFAKTDMIHKAQEGTPLPDILMGLAFALVRNYVATLIRGEPLVPMVSLQGGVMFNQAVVHAFKTLLELEEHEIVTPPHFSVMGAIGCAVLAAGGRRPHAFTLEELKRRAAAAVSEPKARSSVRPLSDVANVETPFVDRNSEAGTPISPLVMGLDVGSVSVKGVMVDALGRLLREDYRLSRSRPLETMEAVTRSLCTDGMTPELIAVTGSGRYLAGRLLEADLIVNEISAQARAAIMFDPEVDTVVEIGGQDSKWISLNEGQLQDFEMNRVCAAGTGSFLMEQADRLGLEIGHEFSEAALASRAPADLGNRCTVFMESDLIHHQNNGASSSDLAAGICLSVVDNYAERVANGKPLGKKVLFLGGVAATPAVRAAFELRTGGRFQSPPFFKVSGALGAALTVLDRVDAGEIQAGRPRLVRFNPASIPRDQFKCAGCSNRCIIDKYRPGNRIVFHGGLCDRWETEAPMRRGDEADPDIFRFRAALLDEIAQRDSGSGTTWGMVRSPQFYEWFPFWKAYLAALGISPALPAANNRRQFERGLRFLRVETCLPIKAMAGQIAELADSGISTIFHPAILTEEPRADGGQVLTYCPYIQASSQFFIDAFEMKWKTPLISYEADPDSFQKEYVRFAESLGFSKSKALAAVSAGLNSRRKFQLQLADEGGRFLNSLAEGEHALIILGKPYHTSDPFLNMNLSSLLGRLGVRAMPADLFAPAEDEEEPEVTWKYQGHMIRVARRIAADARLFPVLITFFGCGPDPFTLRHIRSALGAKPLLVLEMDEHGSRAGIMTRIEAFLEHLRKRPGKAKTESPQLRRAKRASPNARVLFLPMMGDSSYGFAAAARSVGIDARVLPPSDEESEHLGRPHLVGGECHPYALVLGDYLKLAGCLPREEAERSLFYMFGPNECRLGQYPVYMEKVRRELGHSIGVISDVEESMEAFGLSQAQGSRAQLRAWEGMNAFDLLLELYHQIRPAAIDQEEADRTYLRIRNGLFDALSLNRVRDGVEEAVNLLGAIPVSENFDGPVVGVTGDYYTRVVPFANNDVYREIERLGGRLWCPPTFSDAYKLGTFQQFVWGLQSRHPLKVAGKGLLYFLMVVSEFRVKGGPASRRLSPFPADLLGWRKWKSAIEITDIHIPAGISAPIVTALEQLDSGADGLLNLMTLNCSYGTVVTAALTRELRKRSGIPMLTLIYDGLKKTNEKTRLEAFMEQVWDRHERKAAACCHYSERSLQRCR